MNARNQLVIVLAFILGLFWGVSAIAQTYGHSECINKDKIDLNNSFIFFRVVGLIEIDRHTFNNDTSVNFIMYKADKFDVIYKDIKNNIYFPVHCEHEICRVLHLRKEIVNLYDGSLKRFTPYNSLIVPNNLIQN